MSLQEACTREEGKRPWPQRSAPHVWPGGSCGAWATPSCALSIARLSCNMEQRPYQSLGPPGSRGPALDPKPPVPLPTVPPLQPSCLSSSSVAPATQACPCRTRGLGTCCVRGPDGPSQSSGLFTLSPPSAGGAPSRQHVRRAAVCERGLSSSSSPRLRVALCDLNCAPLPRV